MRAIVILLVIAVLIFSVNAFIVSGKVGRIHNEAVKLLESDTEVSWATFKPVLAYSDTNTFGKIARTKEAYFNAMVKSQEGRLSRPDLRKGDMTNVVKAAKIVGDAPLDGPFRARCQRRLMDALSNALDPLEAGANLGAFDAYVNGVKTISDKSLLGNAHQGELGALIEDFGGVDRYAISLRETVKFCEDTAVAALAKIGLTKDDGSCELKVGDSTPQDELYGSEDTFRTISNRINYFCSQWKLSSPPSELVLHSVYSYYNSGLCRLAHFASLPIEANKNITRYMRHTTPPNPSGMSVFDPQILRDNFFGGMAGCFDEARKRAERYLRANDPRRKKLVTYALFSKACQAVLCNDIGTARQILETYLQVAPEDEKVRYVMQSGGVGGIRPKLEFLTVGL